MKKNIRLCILSLLLLTVHSTSDGQIKMLFNDFWKFHKGDVANGQQINFDDSEWRSVELPHDWSIEGPFSQQWASGTGYLPAGIGWYRKTFTCPQRMQSKKVFIYFDGVYMNSEVWLNGHYLGKRPNGYIPFQYEITPYLDKKGKNVMAVKVDHSKFADSRWYTGSGIYRNVYLMATEPVKISLWGVAFTHPQVNTASADANIKVALTNLSSVASPVSVKVSLSDSKGRLVAEKTQPLNAAAKKDSETSFQLKVNNPQFWSVDTPNLYDMRVSVFMKGSMIDDYREQVGIRTIRFDNNEGFFLNGKPTKLKGVCIHHDAGALGAAVPPEVWERRLKKLKELGANAIRMSHYPHQDYLYNLCDQLGFLVIDEAFDEWEYGKNKWIEGWNVGKPGNDGYHEYFDEWADRDLRDMILRNRNHPSIIMWSIGNEIDYPNDPYSHPVLNAGRNPQIFGRGFDSTRPQASRLGILSKRLADVARKADPTRPITAALAGVVMSNTTSYPDNLDVVGYNYQEYRYPEDHKTYPNRIIYGSENGKSLDAWLAVDTNKFISAQFIWTAYDFMGEARRWPSRSSGAGLLDLAGFPKPEFFIRKSWWSDEPTIYLTASRVGRSGQNRGPSISSWNWNAGDTVLVRCYTNTAEAELFLNGRSQGKQRRADTGRREITWQLVYEPGALTVKGYTNGNTSANYALYSTTEAAAIEVAADKASFKKGEKSLAHIEIDLKDKNGHTVFTADNEVTITVEGPAKLLGLESGDLNSHEDYKANKRKAYRGRLLAYVQSTGKAGDIIITISSPGLPEKKVRMSYEL